MARCPRCGKWFWFYPGYSGKHICSECGAVIRRERGLVGFLFGTLEVAGQTRDAYSEEDHRPQSEVDGHGHGWPYARELEQLPRFLHDEVQGSIEGLGAAKNEPSLKGDEIKWGRCSHCRAVVAISSAKFCSNCGASLSHGLKHAKPIQTEKTAKPRNLIIETAEHEEECMVCNLELKESDDVVWCPHCGNPAHRTHLLDWVRIKNVCPICAEYLSEEVFQ